MQTDKWSHRGAHSEWANSDFQVNVIAVKVVLVLKDFIIVIAKNPNL